jgi:diacylglycerol kinase (ATP)
MKTCVIFNPTARGEKAKLFRDQLASLGAQVTLKPTYAAGSGRPLAAEAVREGFEIVVAAGGDGTVNEVLNGIADEPEGLERTQLGVLPLGTINVFARELRLPLDFAAAWKIIEQAREMRIDLPLAEFTKDNRLERRCFGQLAGAGLDSRAIELVDWEQKKSFGPLAYVIAGFKAMREVKPQILATSRGDSVEGELILIGNGRFYGGNFELFPMADPCDGLLDVTVFPKVNWETLLRSGWGWLTTQIHSAAGCHTFQAESFTLTSTRAVAMELDGDNVGHLPATFSVRRQALRVLVP